MWGTSPLSLLAGCRTRASSQPTSSLCSLAEWTNIFVSREWDNKNKVLGLQKIPIFHQQGWPYTCSSTACLKLDIRHHRTSSWATNTTPCCLCSSLRFAFHRPLLGWRPGSWLYHRKESGHLTVQMQTWSLSGRDFNMDLSKGVQKEMLKETTQPKLVSGCGFSREVALGALAGIGIFWSLHIFKDFLRNSFSLAPFCSSFC